MKIMPNAELPKKVKPLMSEYLSRGSDMNLFCLLEPFGEKPVILCVAAVWTRRELPKAVGCRLGWNTLLLLYLPGRGKGQRSAR